MPLVESLSKCTTSAHFKQWSSGKVQNQFSPAVRPLCLSTLWLVRVNAANLLRETLHLEHKQAIMSHYKLCELYSGCYIKGPPSFANI